MQMGFNISNVRLHALQPHRLISKARNSVPAAFRIRAWTHAAADASSAANSSDFNVKEANGTDPHEAPSRRRVTDANCEVPIAHAHLAGSCREANMVSCPCICHSIVSAIIWARPSPHPISSVVATGLPLHHITHLEPCVCLPCYRHMHVMRWGEGRVQNDT